MCSLESNTRTQAVTEPEKSPGGDPGWDSTENTRVWHCSLAWRNSEGMAFRSTSRVSTAAEGRLRMSCGLGTLCSGLGSLCLWISRVKQNSVPWVNTTRKRHLRHPLPLVLPKGSLFTADMLAEEIRRKKRKKTTKTRNCTCDIG